MSERSKDVLLGILVANVFWRKHNFTFADKFWFSVFNFMLSLLLTYIFMGEGYVCLIIVSPLIFLFLSLGIIIGKSMFKRHNKKLNVSIIGTLLIVLLLNTVAANPTQNKVIDTNTIIQRKRFQL